MMGLQKQLKNMLYRKEDVAEVIYDFVVTSFLLV